MSSKSSGGKIQWVEKPCAGGEDRVTTSTVSLSIQRVRREKASASDQGDPWYERSFPQETKSKINKRGKRLLKGQRDKVGAVGTGEGKRSVFLSTEKEEIRQDVPEERGGLDAFLSPVQESQSDQRKGTGKKNAERERESPLLVRKRGSIHDHVRLRKKKAKAIAHTTKTLLEETGSASPNSEKKGSAHPEHRRQKAPSTLAKRFRNQRSTGSKANDGGTCRTKVLHQAKKKGIQNRPPKIWTNEGSRLENSSLQGGGGGWSNTMPRADKQKKGGTEN